MSRSVIVKARYMGPVVVSNAGSQKTIDLAVEKLMDSAQRAKCSIHFKHDTMQVTDRGCREVMMTTDKADIACHGVQSTSNNFLCIIVNQGKTFYGHVFNLPKSDSQKAVAALTQFYGGGGGEVIKAWKLRNKRLFNQTKKSMRRPSVVAAPSEFDNITKGVIEAEKSRALTKEEVAQHLSTFPRVFPGYYLGSQPVAELFGENVVRKAAAANKIERSSGGSDDSVEPVTIVLEPDTIRVVETATDNVSLSLYIKNVSFTCVLDGEDGMDLFAFISLERRIGSMQCHLYHLPAGSAATAYSAVELAFKITTHMEKSAGDNPFAVTDPRREPAPAILFRRQIHRADLKAVRQIGAGQFGAVYIAEQAIRGDAQGGVTKTRRAVKMLKNAASKEAKAEFVHEAEVMLNTDHRNLVQIIGVAIQQKPWLCVLEYMDYGDLRSLVLSCKDKSVLVFPGEHYSFGMQLADGCAYLANKRYVHMDIAARNVLVTRNNVVKLADFGLTRKMDEGKPFLLLREKMRLALKWIALEGMDHKLFSEASDVWSFGVTMWEVAAYGAKPYNKIKTIDIQERVREGLRLPRPPMVSDEMWELLGSCWNASPKDRPNFLEIRSMFRKLLDANPPPKQRDLGQIVASHKSKEASKLQKAGLPKGLARNTSSSSSANQPPPVTMPTNAPRTSSTSSAAKASISSLSLGLSTSQAQSEAPRSPLTSTSSSIAQRMAMFSNSSQSGDTQTVSPTDKVSTLSAKPVARNTSGAKSDKRDRPLPPTPSTGNAMDLGDSFDNDDDVFGDNDVFGSEDMTGDVEGEAAWKKKQRGKGSHAFGFTTGKPSLTGFGVASTHDALPHDQDAGLTAMPTSFSPLSGMRPMSQSTSISSPQLSSAEPPQKSQRLSHGIFGGLFGGKGGKEGHAKKQKKPKKCKKKASKSAGSLNSLASGRSIMDQMIAAYGTDDIDADAVGTKLFK